MQPMKLFPRTRFLAILPVSALVRAQSVPVITSVANAAETATFPRRLSIPRRTINHAADAHSLGSIVAHRPSLRRGRQTAMDFGMVRRRYRSFLQRRLHGSRL